MPRRPAIRAGYSPRAAKRDGAPPASTDANVMTALAAGKEKQAAQTKITQDDVLRMLEREATAGDFANPNTARIRAIELLAKIHGMLTDKVQVEQTGPPPTINVRFGKPADEAQQE